MSSQRDRATVSGGEEYETLPDLLAPGLRLVFVGINPSLYSVRAGHYFARRGNRFWPAFSRSRLSLPVRAGLGRDALGPEDDRLLPTVGIGFTDVVKRPTAGSADLRPADYQRGVPDLLERLGRFEPRAVCFHGVTGFRPVLRDGLDVNRLNIALGPQTERLGDIPIFVVPNPSAANAHFQLEDQIAWYDRLAEWLVS